MQDTRLVSSIQAVQQAPFWPAHESALQDAKPFQTTVERHAIIGIPASTYFAYQVTPLCNARVSNLTQDFK